MMSPSLSLLLMLVAAFQSAETVKGRQNTMKQPKAVEKGVPAKVPFARFGFDQNGGRSLAPSDDWIVIMNRIDFSVDFNRNWFEYKHGFGELGPKKEFWIGNEAIHLLTTGSSYKLHIEMMIDRDFFHADYDSFSIGSEEEKYALHASGYSGTAGDSLTNKTMRNHNGANFSTPDADNGNLRLPNYSCSDVYQAGWWFNSCFDACLTCQEGGNFYWESLSSLPSRSSLPSKSTLYRARMSIKRK